MITFRVIPRLDVKGQNLVKGVHLEGLRVLGLPESFSKYYFEQGADELIYMDMVASLYGRNNLEHIVRRTAENVFIPITVGGGIRSIEDIRRLLRSGADKVAINTAALRNPQLITDSVKIFGSQCIVLSIEAMRISNGHYEAYTDTGREPTGKDVFEWAKQAVDLGVGEILITSIDREGTGDGYDFELISGLINEVSVPVIACGGAGRKEDIATVIKYCQPEAICAASLFHYDAIKSFGVQKREGGNIEYLKKVVSEGCSILRKFEPISVSGIKKYLCENEINNVKYHNQNHQIEKIDRKSYKSPYSKSNPSVILVDYGRSNMFSVVRALESVGAKVEISDDPDAVLKSNKIILAGVGAFGDGMNELHIRGMSEAIKACAMKGIPILGICLGMQLLMEHGEEFGIHQGLGLIPGKVICLTNMNEDVVNVKVPHIGWNKIFVPNGNNGNHVERQNSDLWENEEILRDIPQGSMMYFLHSFIVIPDNQELEVAETSYGPTRFCSVIRKDNLVGCQFHPERSGAHGLKIYQNFLLHS